MKYYVLLLYLNTLFQHGTYSFFKLFNYGSRAAKHLIFDQIRIKKLQCWMIDKLVDSNTQAVLIDQVIKICNGMLVLFIFDVVM